MELVEGEEMSEVIVKKGKFEETVASNVIRQLLSAVFYLHANGVCHRDIKPNNILLSEDGKTVKLTDFNVAKFCDDEIQIKKYSSVLKSNYKMWTFTGTNAFLAPEVFIDSEYTEALDMWSVGVTIYFMLSGRHPFEAEYQLEQIELIKEAKVAFEGEQWEDISEDAKDLIGNCLKKNYQERFAPSEALMHPWICKTLKGAESNKSHEKLVTQFRAERHNSMNESANTRTLERQSSQPNLKRLPRKSDASVPQKSALSSYSKNKPAFFDEAEK